MQWDYFEYKVSGFFLSAFINDDRVGFLDEEERQYNDFVNAAIANAKKAGFTVGHWSYDESLGFCRCEITGLLTDCVVIKLMVYKE